MICSNRNSSLQQFFLVWTRNPTNIGVLGQRFGETRKYHQVLECKRKREILRYYGFFCLHCVLRNRVCVPVSVYREQQRGLVRQSVAIVQGAGFD